MDLNRAMIAGRLGRDPEIRTMTSGDKVANFPVASSERWKDKTTGEKRERTEWHRVTVWGQSADFVEKYLRKGARCYVEGQIQTRKWTGNDGVEKYTTEIVVRWPMGDVKVIDWPDREADPGPSEPDLAGTGVQAPAAAPALTQSDLDDEIPF
jgi:single-strand DNA-binding protein|tara:strand:+ start:4958 stop:5416 length:459 start_codon:yes stop_codon:yes gene_type:complete